MNDPGGYRLWRANPYRVDRSDYPDRAKLDRDNYHDRRPS